mgnify:CR=1 FL=1
MSDEKTLLEEQLEQAPLEIEIDDQNTASESRQAAEEARVVEDGDKEFSKRVQKRIYTLVTQRKEAEAAAETARGEVAGFKARLERLEENRSHEAGVLSRAPGRPQSCAENRGNAAHAANPAENYISDGRQGGTDCS